jgi:predicted NUDIX family NTP pyrophosphohydrolase
MRHGCNPQRGRRPSPLPTARRAFGGRAALTSCARRDIGENWGMPKQSAGLLLYRFTGGQPEVLLVHPGGPYWRRKDDGAWSIPKGLCELDEEPLVAARREFLEETGHAPEGEVTALGTFQQSASKDITIWAVEGEFQPSALQSGMVQLEWPPRSGTIQEFPEVDRAAWMTPDEAHLKIIKGQVQVLDALLLHLDAKRSGRS